MDTSYFWNNYYLESGGVVRSACCHWDELGAWLRWMTTPLDPVVAAVEGDSGGYDDDGIDSAHHDPGGSPPGGVEMDGTLLLAVAGAMAGAVTFSKSHFLQMHNNDSSRSTVV